MATAPTGFEFSNLPAFAHCERMSCENAGKQFKYEELTEIAGNGTEQRRRVCPMCLAYYVEKRTLRQTQGVFFSAYRDP